LAADLLAHGLIRASFVPDTQTQELRTLLRTMIEAVISGESDPRKLANLANYRLKTSREKLREALRGRVTEHHRFLLRLHLNQIDALDASIATIHEQVEAGIAPFRAAVGQVMTIPGIREIGAQVIVSEIGTDMSWFPSEGHLISWAGLCPRNEERR
jgi:transposase